MNLFVLDEDSWKAARYHCDQHVGKMAVEAAQLLSSAISVLSNRYIEVPNKNGTRMLRKYQQIPGLYKPTHYNHPCCKWVRESVHNAAWAYYLGLDLLEECRFRGFDPRISTREILRNVCRHWAVFPNVPPTPHVVAINPERYPTVNIDPADPVGTYRDYYRKGKARFATKGAATWTNREKPEWL